MRQYLETNVSLIFLGLLIFLSVVPSTGFALTISGNNVGIGTDTPGQPLDVVGNVNASGTVTAGSFTGSGSSLTGITPGQVGAAAASHTHNGSDITSQTISSNQLADNAVLPVNIAFYSKVAIVATSGGDYNNPATAMADYAAWCGTPSVTNPCLLKIMPGVYSISTLPVQMRNYIDIEGSGENVTVIQGNIDSSTSGVVTGASNAEIRFLTVKNTGGGTVAVAIYNGFASPKLTNLTATASGGSLSNLGVYNYNYSSPVMTNVTATASGDTYSYGVHNYYSSSPVMTNVTATASGGSGSNNWGVSNYNSSSPVMTNVTATASGGINSYGVYNQNSSSPVMTNVTATASGSATNYGVYNHSSSSPVMTNVTATASGGTSNYGVWNSSSSSTVRINHSVIKGSTNTIFNSTSVTTYVGNTELDGGPVSNAGTLTCAGVYDENYIFYASTCP